MGNGKSLPPVFGNRYHESNPDAVDLTPLAPSRAQQDYQTVEELVAAYLEHLQRNGQGTTYRDAAASLRGRILPRFGRLPLWKLNPAGLEAAHAADPHPVAANRAMAYLKAAWNRGERMGWCPPNSNPLRFFGDFAAPEAPRSRILSEAELPRVLTEIAKLRADWTDGPASWAAVLLVLLTGARHREILTLRWAEVHEGALHLSRSKTGQKVIFLSEQAMAILDQVAGAGERGEFVFPGVDLRRTWEKIREAAGCADVTIHDLRRTYASRLIASGKVELADVAKALGQKTLRVTAFTYTPLTKARQRAIADIGSRMILAPNQEGTE